MQDYHAEFVEIYNKNITRPGADRLLNWLETTDFFTAPASTRFHGACECGLVMHSINVYNAMMQHFFTEGESAESYAICGLLHDLCKANFYKVGTRNVKNDVTGQWEKVPFYQVADQLPYGHGEKSVYLIEHFMRLKTAEAIAIRWHMGGFDDAVRGGSFAVSDAYNTYPLAVKLHIADLTATYLMERAQARSRTATRKANNQQNKRCRTESSSVRQRLFNFSTGQLSMSSKAASPFFASALASPCLTKHIVTKLSATNSAAYGNSTR